jgi:hypothetical protein
VEAVGKSHTLQGALLAVVLLLAASAFASADNNKGHMALLNPATIGGTQLAAGEYTVQWTGTGDQVQLQVLRGKKTVASAPAHITKLERPAREDSVMVEPNDQGGHAVSRINFGKKDFALELEGEAGGAAGSSGSAK